MLQQQNNMQSKWKKRGAWRRGIASRADKGAVPIMLVPGHVPARVQVRRARARSSSPLHVTISSHALERPAKFHGAAGFCVQRMLLERVLKPKRCVSFQGAPSALLLSLDLHRAHT
jgi:hypothetical protein